MTALLLTAAPARAATLTVTDNGDTATGVTCSDVDHCPSIRSALEKAATLPGPDTIVVAAGAYQLTAGELYIDSNVTLQGASARSTTVRGSGSFRVLEVAPGWTANVSHMTLRDGTANATSSFRPGGIVRNSGALTLDHVHVTGGHASSGGGVANTDGNLVIRQSLIDHNAADIGGADSGGILNFGSGANVPHSIEVSDSTIAFNTANGAGGGVFAWGDAGTGTVTLTRVTVAYNSAGAFGGIGMSDSGRETIRIGQSLVASNAPGNCAGTLPNSLGTNFEATSTCGFDHPNADLRMTDELTDLGGETDAIRMGAGSAIVDAGGACDGADQRDIGRPQGLGCDAGALELEPGALISDGPAGATTQASVSFSFSGTGVAFECRLDGESFSACTSPKVYAALADGDHMFAVRAVDDSGAPIGAPAVRSFRVDTTPQATPTPNPTPTPTPTPVPGKTVVGATVRGKVLVKLPGKGFVDLEGTQSIPLGSTVDTKRGTISLTAKTGQSATFRDGIFKITQTKTTTDLTLSEALAKCPKQHASAAAKKPKTRKLWGNGSGSFRTRGQYSAATVRGTEWLVQDSCAGTLTRVRKGVVAVRDNVRRKTIVLRAGKKYLARPRR